MPEAVAPTVASPSAGASDRAHAPSERERPSTAALTLIAVVAGLVLLAQIPIAVRLLAPDPIFEADHARAVLDVNAIAVIFTVGIAGLAPRRWRALALVPGALLAAATAAAAVTLGGHAGDAAMAILTIAAAWWTGRAILRMVGAPALQSVFIVELAVGLGLAGLTVLALGRLHLLRWWSVGVLAIALGALGVCVAAREGWVRREAAWRAVAGSPVGTACGGLLLLQLGWAIVWLSAPEIMFDPLYGKAYLPQLWAHTGSIGPLLIHPQLNVAGLAQVVAVPGHTVGAADVGRYLQTLAWMALAATVWWAGRRSVAGPLAALAVGIVPQIVWQMPTPHDDLLITLGVVALAVAVLRTVPSRAADGDAQAAGRQVGTAVAIGLLAGACVWLKLHVLVLTLVMAAGWVIAAGPRRSLGLRAVGVALGGLAIAGPTFALRWIDTGNPVFPSYNTIFKSPYYPPIDEQFNFPFWPQAHMWEIVKVPYETIFKPSLMNDALPPGALGLLVAALVLGVAIGWRQSDRRAGVIAWVALLAGVAAWWVQFRYLRYLLPGALVALLLIVTQLSAWRPSRAVAATVLVVAGTASALYLPSTVASFWNVPYRKVPFGAAFGHWDRDNYLRFLFPEKDALAAYQRLAPRGSNALSDAYERVYLTDRDLSPRWEVEARMMLSAPLPRDPDDALRRLRALGIGWAILTGPHRETQGQDWLAMLLARHGEVAFADRGWDVYRFVQHPPRPHLAPLGATGGGVRACAGQTLAVQVTTAAGGQDAVITLNSDSGDALSGHTSGNVPPDATGWVYGTAPPNTHVINVAATPGAGGAIEHVRAGVLGGCGSRIR